MSLAYPIPRQTRQVILTAAGGQTVFGPSDFILFDPEDVQVAVKVGGGGFTLLDQSAYTVAPAAPFTAWPAIFTITLDTARGAGDLVWIKGARLGSRTTDVTRAGRILSQPLEGELDRAVATEQELRRDVDALIAGGASGSLIASGIGNDSAVQGGTVAEALDFLQKAIGDDVRAFDYGVAADGTDIGPGLNRAIAAAAAKGYTGIILPAGNLIQLTPAYLNRWTTDPNALTVPGLKIKGDFRGVTTIDSAVANTHCIQVNPEWKRATKALAGITAGTGGALVTATHYVQITVTDPAGNEIFVTLPKSIAVNSPGSIAVNLPALNTGWKYNLYCDTNAQPAHYALVNGVDAKLLAGGGVVQIAAIGSAHAVPTDKRAIWQEVEFSDLTITNSTNAAAASGILLFRVGYSTVQRCTFKGLTEDGITLPNYVGDFDGSFNVTHIDCKFDGCKGWGINAAGAALELSNFTVDRCVFNLCGTPWANINVNVAISAINNSATPTVTTAAPHNFVIHDQVYISNVGGMALPAAYYRVGTVPTASTFTLVDLNGNAVDTSALGAFTAGGTVSLAWRPPVWDPVNLKASGSGGIAWLGLIGTITNSNFTQCYNVNIYAAENGASDNLALAQIDNENTYGKGIYLASLVGGSYFGGEILSATALGPTLGGVQLGTGFNAGGVSGFTIAGIKVRSDVTPATAFEQFQNTAAGASFINTNRVVAGTIRWQIFDAAGQKRYDGFRFDPIEGQCKLTVSALDTLTVAPIGLGGVMPIKLAATGEWIAVHLPLGGVSKVLGAPLAATTTYNIWLANLADANSPISLGIEVTADATAISTEGFSVKGTDHTRLFVGTAQTDGGGHFQTTSAVVSQYPASGLVAHAVTRPMLSQGLALSIMGNATNATADVADIAAASDNTVFRRSGTALGFGAIDLSQSNAVGASVLSATNGGLGAASPTAHGVLIAEGSSAAASVVGGTGKVLQGQGSGSDPIFTSVPSLGTAGSQAGGLQLANLTSGALTVSPPTGALGSVTNTLQAANDTFVYRNTTDTLTGKTLDTAGAGNVLKINGTQVSAVTGTGNTAVLSASPTITGTLTASTIAPTTINAYTLGGQISGAGNNVDNVVIGSGTPLAGTFTTLKGNTSTTTPQVLGGTAAGSSLILQSTSGVGSGDSVVIKTGNNGSLSTLRATQTGVGINTPGNPLVDLQVGGAGGSNAGFEVIAGATVNFQFFNRNSSAYAPAIIAGSQLTFQAGAPATVLQLTSGTAAITGVFQTKQGSVAVANGLNSNIATPSASWVRLTGPTGAFSIGGFTGGADGQELVVYNTTAQTMTIVNEDASSTAGNRIKTLTGGNVVLRATATSSATFRYDATDSRWILISSN